MNDIERIFQFEGKQLRMAVGEEGEAMFCGKDVCEMLELNNPHTNISRIDVEDKGSIIIATPGGPQKMIFVNESGLYWLILGSRKSAAKRFQKWVTGEVLPSIRQTGCYQMPELSRQQIIELALESEREREELSAQVAVLQPKADFYDAVADTEDTFSIGETAKLLQFARMGPNNLMNFLRTFGYLMQGNVAKQEFIEKGYIKLAEHIYEFTDGSYRISLTTRVRQKGVEFIRTLLTAAGH